MTTIDLTKREIKFLLDSLEDANRSYVSKGWSRDFSWEDEHDAIEKKLNQALLKEKEPDTTNPLLNSLMAGIIVGQIIAFIYIFLYL